MPVWEYKPPPEPACEVLQYRFEVMPGHWGYAEQWLYRGKVVWFVLTHEIEIDDERHVVGRVDCCHGEVHEHQFFSDGSEGTRRIIAPIRQRTAYEDVDAAFERCNTEFDERWNERVRRWKACR